MSMTESGPQFESYEEMQKFLVAANKMHKKTKSSLAGSSSFPDVGEKPSKKLTKAVTKTAPKKKGHSSVDPVASEVADDSIFQTVSFYVRANDTIESVAKDAREERKIRNSNVLVFVHAHAFSEACLPKCKEQM